MGTPAPQSRSGVIASQIRTSVGVFGQVFAVPDLRRLLGAYVGFTIAESPPPMANFFSILIYAYNVGGAAAVGVVTFLQLIPAALFAPFGSTFGDRYRRETVLPVAYGLIAASTAALAVAIAADLSVSMVYLFAAVNATVLTLVRPVQDSLLPAGSQHRAGHGRLRGRWHRREREHRRRAAARRVRHRRMGHRHGVLDHHRAPPHRNRSGAPDRDPHQAGPPRRDQDVRRGDQGLRSPVERPQAANAGRDSHRRRPPVRAPRRTHRRPGLRGPRIRRVRRGLAQLGDRCRLSRRIGTHCAAHRSHPARAMDETRSLSVRVAAAPRRLPSRTGLGADCPRHPGYRADTGRRDGKDDAATGPTPLSPGSSVCSKAPHSPRREWDPSWQPW